MGVPSFVNEFWTSSQRAAHVLHEVSYRACFKPQLPRFFIERLTRPGDLVHDPFMGRGTTLVEAGLLGRLPCGSDINPLSQILVAPRLATPDLAEVEARLRHIPFSSPEGVPEDLLAFYHPETLAEIVALRGYLLERQDRGSLDPVDRWIRMVATNRLTGHSPGFFSVYTLPPNQAASVVSQRKINAKRQQEPPRRSVPGLILRKSSKLLTEGGLNCGARLWTAPADAIPGLESESVALVVTSPPFLDVVQYAQDNWLRGWFNGIDAKTVSISMLRDLEAWQAAMTAALREIARVLAPGGHVAFEVGEVRGGSVRLEEHVIPAGRAAGLEPQLVLINVQEFTKTANCWGVANNKLGTNSNRVVLLRKPA